MALQGSCHCGKTRFEVSEAPASATTCTCSYCAKSGGLWAYYPPEQFKLLTREADSALYLWGSKTVQHFYCATCGCTTYGVSPVWENMKPHPTRRQVSVNARLFDNFDLAALPVKVIDGKNLW